MPTLKTDLKKTKPRKVTKSFSSRFRKIFSTNANVLKVGKPVKNKFLNDLIKKY